MRRCSTQFPLLLSTTPWESYHLHQESDIPSKSSFTARCSFSSCSLSLNAHRPGMFRIQGSGRKKKTPGLFIQAQKNELTLALRHARDPVETGANCNFAHDQRELRAQPDLVATRLCFQFSRKARSGRHPEVGSPAPFGSVVRAEQPVACSQGRQEVSTLETASNPIRILRPRRRQRQCRPYMFLGHGRNPDEPIKIYIEHVLQASNKSVCINMYILRFICSSCSSVG